MKGKEKKEGVTDLRLVDVPNEIHLKLIKHADKVKYKEGRKLTKPLAAIELLDKATKHIKI